MGKHFCRRNLGHIFVLIIYAYKLFSLTSLPSFKHQLFSPGPALFSPSSLCHSPPPPLPTPLPSHPLESSSIISSTREPFFSEASWSMPDSSPLCTHVLSAQCSHFAQRLSLQLQWVMIHVSLLFTLLCQWYSYFCLDYKTLGNPVHL